MSPPRRHRTSAGDDDHERSSSTRKAKRARTDGEDSDDVAAHGKTRMRVTRACNECRKRKDRCDGGRPECRPCLNAGRSCSYNPPKKRGLRTGYVRALEILLGMVFSSIDESDPWISALLGGQGWKPPFRLAALGPTLVDDGDACEGFIDAWRKTEVLKHIEQWLSVAEPLENEHEGNSDKSFDSRVKEAIPLMAKIRGEQDNQNNNTIIDTASPMNTNTTSPARNTSQDTVTIPSTSCSIAQDAENNINPILMATQGFSPMEDTTMRQESLSRPQSGRSELPDNWSMLLDAYFSNTHSWLPIFQKHEILRLAYVLERCDNRSSTADSMSHGDRCSLWAVLAYSSHLSKTEEPSTSAATLHARTRHLLGERLDKYELGHVRAHMILALLHLSRGDKPATWLAAGNATYAAAALLLAPDTMTSTQGQIDEGAKRTLACCFVLETMVASWLGTRPYFKPSDLTQVGTLATDSMEEWEPWQMRDGQGAYRSHHGPGHVISTFNRLVQLAVCLNDLLRFRNEDGERERVHKLDGALESWRQKSHPQSQTSCEAEASPQIFNLQLMYSGISEVIKTEQLRLAGVRPSFDVNGSCGRMEEQCRLLDQRMKSMGTSSTPPTVIILLCWFERSVDSQARFQNHPRARMELQTLRLSISTTTESFLQTRTPLNNAQGSVANFFNTGSMSNSFVQPSRQPTQSAFRLGFATPASSGLSSQSRELNPLIHQGLGDADHRSSAKDTPTGQSNLFTAQTPGLMSQPPSMGPDMNIDPLLDAAEMDDKELFQSLASLDSADWSTNPPEFMEHLGIPRGIASDLQSFFDKDPG